MEPLRYATYEFSIIKNLRISTSGNVPINFDSLIDDMSSLTLIVNNIQSLQNINSPHSNLDTVPNSLISRKVIFVKELKLASKLTNIFDERDDSNKEKDNEPLQIIKKEKNQQE